MCVRVTPERKQILISNSGVQKKQTNKKLSHTVPIIKK